MKRYYSAGSCSTSCHITLEEAGLKYQAIPVDWDNPQDPNTVLVTSLNPLGTLPILVTDQSMQLDQNVAIHTYAADLSPEKKLIPPQGTPERSIALNWLSFVASDLHKSFGPIFGASGVSPDKNIQDMVKNAAAKNVNQCLSHLDKSLEGKDYLMGDDFGIADAYAFVVTGWAPRVGIALDDYKNIQAYRTRISQRPAVQRVLKEEGLLD